jgi:hypothetical protein
VGIHASIRINGFNFQSVNPALAIIWNLSYFFPVKLLLLRYEMHKRKFCIIRDKTDIMIANEFSIQRVAGDTCTTYIYMITNNK